MRSQRTRRNMQGNYDYARSGIHIQMPVHSYSNVVIVKYTVHCTHTLIAMYACSTAASTSVLSTDTSQLNGINMSVIPSTVSFQFHVYMLCPCYAFSVLGSHADAISGLRRNQMFSNKIVPMDKLNASSAQVPWQLSSNTQKLPSQIVNKQIGGKKCIPIQM